jgi:hypothetical protein
MLHNDKTCQLDGKKSDCTLTISVCLNWYRFFTHLIDWVNHVTAALKGRRDEFLNYHQQAFAEVAAIVKVCHKTA